MSVSSVIAFVQDVGTRWGTLVTGGSFIGALGIWQGLGHPVKSWLFWIIAASALLTACYQSWAEHLAQLSALRAKFASPTLRLAINSIWWGSSERNQFVVTLGVTIENPYGPATAMRSVEVALLNSLSGIEFVAEMPIPSNDGHQVILPAGHSLHLPRSKWLMERAFVSAVQPGAAVSGWLLCEFRGFTESAFVKDQVLLCLRVTDIVSGKLHETVVDFGNEEAGVKLPGIGNIGQTFSGVGNANAS